jgi:hypothetical protein
VNDVKRKWLQFSLFDLVLSITVIALATSLDFIYFLRPTDDAELSIYLVCISVVASIAALLFANGQNKTGVSRFMIMVLFVFLANFICCPSLARSSLAARETQAAFTLKSLAEAQEIFHGKDRNGDGVLEYAQTVAALYESVPGKADIKLISDDLRNAEGPNGMAIRGYHYRVLKYYKAAKGEESYLNESDQMTLGYAFVAYPSKYGISGYNTFIISNRGTIYQNDYGPDTRSIAEEMKVFDPPNVDYDLKMRGE